ncbi:MaoC/PaaZ C-terminal domain-containing protein [Angustibacter sp. McL0619]|uniref:MaoC/PaaZ C-terminal domain-containing protein n=1 Tax=Angustibacter sp. McL0619 TaxID=3415676 RepID=UPI003CF34E8A
MRTIALDADPNLLALTARAALNRGRADELPPVEVVRTGVTAPVDRLVRYSRVCGFDVTGYLPSPFVHVLAFPLQTALLGRPDFPLPLPGLVHVANRLELRRPVRVGEPLDLSVRAADLRPHPRGRQVDVLSEASIDGEVVWRGRSTYLARQAAARPGEPAAHPTAAVDAGLPPHARWRLPADLGRRYAAVSGDHNPIHLNPLAAKAFGFPRTIMHGMWSLARCVSSIGARAPAAAVVDVEFRRPVLLPSTVQLRMQPSDGGWDLLLTGSTRSDREPTVHLRGSLRPLSRLR